MDPNCSDPGAGRLPGRSAPYPEDDTLAGGAGVSRKSAYVWHKAWSLAGTEALLSKGPGGQSCRLSDGQMQRLEATLDAGPAAYGWSETVWAHLKRGVGNLAACTLDQLAMIIGTRLKQMQYRPGLLDAFVTHTGLIASSRSK